MVVSSRGDGTDRNEGNRNEERRRRQSRSSSNSHRPTPSSFFCRRERHDSVRVRHRWPRDENVGSRDWRGGGASACPASHERRTRKPVGLVCAWPTTRKVLLQPPRARTYPRLLRFPTRRRTARPAALEAPGARADREPQTQTPHPLPTVVRVRRALFRRRRFGCKGCLCRLRPVPPIESLGISDPKATLDPAMNATPPPKENATVVVSIRNVLGRGVGTGDRVPGVADRPHDR